MPTNFTNSPNGPHDPTRQSQYRSDERYPVARHDVSLHSRFDAGIVTRVPEPSPSRWDDPRVVDRKSEHVSPADYVVRSPHYLVHSNRGGNNDRDIYTASTLDNPTDQKFRPSRLFDSDEISH
jgi:hypothetical protein